MPDEKIETKEIDAPKQDDRLSKMAAEIGRLKIEALAQSAGAIDPAKVAEVVSGFTKPDIDALGIVKIAIVDPETGEKLRNTNGEDMTVGAYIQQLKADPDHGYLFTDGAAGKPKANSGGLEAETNPWCHSTFNLTEQARLLKSDPAYALRLKDAARGTQVDNPFSAAGFNLTRQSQILRDDPALAAKLKAAVAPKEPNPWMAGAGFNLTRQVLLVRSDPSRAAILKAEAALANGPDKPKSCIFTPPPGSFRRRA